MCGIFGILVGEDSGISTKLLKDTVDYSLRLSESRGKEASGIAIRFGQSMYVYKEPVAASKLMKSDKYRHLFCLIPEDQGHAGSNLNIPITVLGHSRLVTNGAGELNSNNQPVIKDGAVGVHNGIIVNDADLWKSFPALERKYDVDTEVFLSLLQMSRKKKGALINAVRNTFSYIKGSVSAAVLLDDVSLAVLVTNTGSLYICTSKSGKLLVFTSEQYSLKQLVSSEAMNGLFDVNTISQMKAGTGYVVNLLNMERQMFTLEGDVSDSVQTDSIIDPKLKINALYHLPAVIISPKNDYSLKVETKQSMMRTWEQLYSGEINLRRCTRCLFPDTVPFISFDGKGVCNYCRNYERRSNYQKVKGEAALEEIIAKYKSTSGEPNCIVGFSGGRDSSFALDYVKNVLKMNPIAFTYDWGMLTDLGRRNQSRVCSELGVENIIVSADIKEKRKNIQRNLFAWLKKPELGMVPLLMAGDKQFYHYFHKIRGQTGVKLFIWAGGHKSEEDPFKYGFCGIKHGTDSLMDRITGLSLADKIKLMRYCAWNYMTNLSYINLSIFDTLFAYYCTYILPDDYLYLFEYVEWDEEKVMSTIRNKFDWEMATDTIATWRIDDGTAPFYNYIYMTIAGFTEFDHFRSTQIRDGKINREQGLELVKGENKPRFEAIEWYAAAVGFDCNRAIDIINSTPKLYEK